MRVLGELFEPVEAETPFGGQAVSYASLGSVWLRLDGRRRRERSEAGGLGVVEVATAETRTDPRLIEGRVIRVGGADWRIVQADVEADRPGRCDLQLERTR
ncbi:phage head completion protein [Brevundimonas aurifodinae]|uniref:Phage head-tail adapter protein n=2 Tax=Brevundimonas TaxID=41275 RepID=A0ABV1NMH8_9CAUL|nr:MAG: phage head-tail adapter protein [Brevundimonas sp. 12-68-7]OYX36123.1 MAG: phage head-tail adapter protein [Brevundimonas subvibrioides]